MIHSCFGIRLLCFVMIYCVGMLSIAGAAPLQLKSDGIVIDLKRDGYSISVDGIPFSGGAQFSLTDPHWQDAYYVYMQDLERADKIKQGEQENGGTLSFSTALRSEKSVATAETSQTIEILPGRKIRFSLESNATTSTPVLLENRIASIAENWVSNRSFHAIMADGKSTSRRAFAWPVSDKTDESKVAAKFSSMTIDSPYGPLKIMTSGTAEMTLMDYRLSPWANGQRYFWFGVLGTRMPEDGLKYEVTIQFPPAQAQQDKQEIVAKPTVNAGQVIYQTPNSDDVVLPTPKDIAWTDENLPVGKTISFQLSVQPLEHVTLRTRDEQTVRWELPALMEEAQEVIAHLSERWHDNFGVKLSATESDDNSTASVKFHAHWDMPDWQRDEAYGLSVNGDGLAILARSAIGLRNALTTMEQLFRRDTDGAWSLRGVNITDYPALPFRGIHFFSGREGSPLQQKMISEILAPLKINKLVYQVDYLEWDSLPEPHHARYSMSKSEAKTVADTAAAAGIEVIPLVNTFGHNEWLLERPAMRHLADDPDHPYAYDPSNPEVYRICELIYDEAIALFRPRIIHIGHDEVTMHGFPKKPANQAVGATKLLIDDTLHYHKYLEGRGVRTMIWGDMFLGPGEAPDACFAPTIAEAKRRRELLPKDIVIADWHYRPADPAEYKSLSIFSEAGFDTIACTWYQPKNIGNFVQAVAEERKQTTAALGLMQTTWAGYSFDGQSLASNFEQYAAYVSAAQAAWTGDAEQAIKLDYQSEFLRRWDQPATGALQRGWQVELGAIANAALTPALAAELGLATRAFVGIEPGQNDFGAYRFSLAERDGNAAALLTSASVRLEGLDASGEVLLAMASAISVPTGTNVGEVILTADDGTTASTALVYGKNIFGIADGAQSLQAPVIWRSGEVKANQGAAVIHLLRLAVPEGQVVESLEIRPGGVSDIMLIGISGAEV